MASQGRVSFEVEPEEDTASQHTVQAAKSEDYFSSTGSDDGRQARRLSMSMSISMPPRPAEAGLAVTALQYLPMPVLVLSGDSKILLANEAMARLLGIDLYSTECNQNPGQAAGSNEEDTNHECRHPTDILYGKTLSDLGIDLMRGGNAVFIAWEEFFKTLVLDASRAQVPDTNLNLYHSDGVQSETTTPTRHKRSASRTSRTSQKSKQRAEVHDAVVEVVFPTQRDDETGLPRTKHEITEHVQAQMIVSTWATEDDVFFTLTFTASADGSVSSGSSFAETVASSSRVVSRPATSTTGHSLQSGLSSASSTSSGQRQHDPHNNIRSPSSNGGTPLVKDFPPRGPPSRSTAASAPTIFSKTNRLKNALLNSMNIPAYAMWKDQSFGVPNIAAVRLLYPYIQATDELDGSDAHQFLSQFVLYTEDFSTELAMDDFPIMRLMREMTPFTDFRVGMYSAKDGSRLLFDVSGEVLTDDKGEFLGGLVLFNDVTSFTNIINKQQKENEQQFEAISNMVPIMIWRTDPVGTHDYYNDRWFSYTGLTPEESYGEGWMNAFHPDDLAVVGPIWEHCLKTGDEYLVEYRCRNAAGEWRWMLGRAVPMRDADGTILKW